VYGVISMIQEALPYLKASRGMIVNISSGLTKMNLPLVAPYASTKYMLNALTNAMRIELRTYGIRVVNYLPPMVRTPFYQNNIRAKGSKRTEMGERKMATPQWTADRIIRAMRSGKREASEAGMSGIMNLLMPGFMDNIFYKTMIAGRK
jgi:short-subunit dehydrogenase